MSPRQIDEHRDGISIEDRWKAKGGRHGKRWMVKVRDSRLQRYKQKAFVDLGAGKAWAKQLRARMELSEASAGTWPLDEVISECVAHMLKEGRNEAYIKNIKRHGELLKSVGVRDLAEDGLHAKLRLFMDLPTEEKHRWRKDSSAAAASTMRIRFGYARSLVTYAMRYMGMRHSPLLGFNLPARVTASAVAKTSDQETYALEEVRAVLALNRRDDPIWIAFVIAVYAGLRAFEIRALRWESIDWGTHTLRVAIGKGLKVRTVPIQPDLYEFLHGLGGPGATQPRLGPVLAMSARRLQIFHLRPLLDLAKVKWDRGASELTGLPRRLTWHAARRTCAAASLACGVDPLVIQRSLGHEEMDLTGEYAGAFTRWKHQVEEEGWPRGRLCFWSPPRPQEHSATSSAVVR